MEINLRSVPAEQAGGAYVGETAPSFEEFYEASFRRVFTALCLVTGSRHEAEEIAQDAFVRVFERWDRVGRLEDPTGYLFRVSMNLFRSRYRRALLRIRRELLLAPEATDDLIDAESRLRIQGHAVGIIGPAARSPSPAPARRFRRRSSWAARSRRRRGRAGAGAPWRFSRPGMFLP